ncbi:MAG: DAK2 domain-containing protein [Chloroflexi bacterium]|nr:DAK2 domain-containing protein [Chloroflexota bacterium]
MSESSSAETQQTSVDTEPLTTGRGLRTGLQAGLDWLRANSEAIDRLNVFPVPDGDTGANMVLTFEAALDEVKNTISDSLSDVAGAAARGALLGARGNSGVILSQIVGGMAKGLQGLSECSALQFAKSLNKASEVAYDAVSKPVEGTMLTVIRHAASGAMEAAEEEESVESVIAQATESAAKSVEDTPNRLAVLKEAGVVDAGGQGVFIILEGLLKYSRGEEIEGEVVLDRSEETFAAFAQEHSGDEHGFCTQFLIRGSDLDVPATRTALESMADWAIIVGDPDLVRVHLHTERPGDILNYGVRLGELDRISIENMDLQQVEHFAGVAEPSVPEVDDSNLVAVTMGNGFQNIFASLGARIVPGGQTMNPSAAQILEAVEACPGDGVVVLPNNSNVVLAAKQAAAESDKDVEVVETVTVPHGIAAALAYNPNGELSGNRDNMTAALDGVTVLEITKAVRDSQVGGLDVREGDFIGLLDGKLRASGETVETVLGALYEEVGDFDVELATIYLGAGLEGTDAGVVTETLEAAFPDVEFEIADGGQPHYDYIISLE